MPRIAFLSLPFLFFLPGYLTDRVIFRNREILSPGEKLFLPISTSVLLSTWFGLVLAEFGWFSLPALCLLVAVYCVLAWLVERLLLLPFFGGRRVLGRVVRNPMPALPTRDHARASPAVGVRAGVDWIFVGILALGTLLAAHPAEYILGNYDAGTYVNVGASIASTGAIVIHDPMVQSLPLDPSREFFWDMTNPFMLSTQLRLPGFFVTDAALGLVRPQFLHLYPVWLAIFDSALGLRWGLYATPIIGLLGSVAAYFCARTLFGRNLARLAFFLLVVTVPQFWFARYPVAEAMTQFLLLTGMYTFLRSRALTLSPEQTPVPNGDARPDVQDPSSDQRVSSIGFPLIAGVAFAEVFLVRADAILLLAPLGVYALWVVVSRQWRREHWAFFLAFGALLVHALAHMWVFAPDYVYFQYSHFLRMKNIDKLLPGGKGLPSAQDWFRNPASLLSLVAVGMVGLVALLVLDRIVRLGLSRWGAHFSSWLDRYSSLLRWIGAGFIALTFILVYFVFPHPRTLEAYVGGETPISQSANLIKLGWYLSPFGLVLAVIGAAVVVRHDLDRHNAFFFGTGALFSVFYLEELYSNPHYIYTTRHYIPLVIPLFVLLAARALQFLWRAGTRDPREVKGDSARAAGPSRLFGQILRSDSAARLARIAAVGALALWLAYNVYVMGLVDATRARGFALRVPFVDSSIQLGPLRVDPISDSILGVPELGGAFDQVQALANQLDPNGVIIFSSNGDEPALIATPLRFIFGRDALVSHTSQPNGSKIAALIDTWRAQGREVILAYGTNGGKLAVPGYALAPAGHFALDVKQWAFSYQYMPRIAWRVNLSYALYRALSSSAGTAYPFKIDFGGDDYPMLVSGFLERAIGADTRWMGLIPDLGTPAAKPESLTATLRVPEEGSLASSESPSGSAAPRPASAVRQVPAASLDLALTVRAPRDRMRLVVKSGNTTFGEADLSTEFATYHFTLSREDLKREGDTFLIDLQTPAFADPDGRILGAEFKEAVVGNR